MVGGVTQAVQHARMVCPRILAKDKNGIGMVKIVKTDGAFTHADAAFQARTACLVTHIGAVREVIGAQHAAEQLIKPGGFITGATRGVKLHLIRVIHRFNMLCDERKGIIPADGFVMIAFGVVAQRMCQAALIFQKIVALCIQGCHAVFGKKVGINNAARGFPGDGFCTVFAEAKGTFIVIAPGTARAVEAACFVHAHEVTQIFQRSFTVENKTCGGFQ